MRWIKRVSEKASYVVEFVSSAAREFRLLPEKTKKQVRKSIDSLCENPRLPGVKKLVGHEKLYRLRVGQYRVIFRIDDKNNLVLITRVRHRRDVYS